MIALPFALPPLWRYVGAALLVAAVVAISVTTMTRAYNGVYDRGFAAGRSEQLNAQLTEALKQQKAAYEAQVKYDKLVASIPDQIQAAVESVPPKVKVVQEAARHDANYRDYRRPAAVDRLRHEQLEQIRSVAGSQ